MRNWKLVEEILDDLSFGTRKFRARFNDQDRRILDRDFQDTLELLEEGGFIRCAGAGYDHYLLRHILGNDPESWMYNILYPRKITWSGYDLLDSIKARTRKESRT